jgi:crotonobetainyl-CoA:carnitine CoA-transferase CaiB-like acyl-CoA transferase
MTALYAREQRGDGRGDWAQTSLAAAASLTQLLFQFQEAPAGVRGPLAKGPTDTQRIYKVSDGWIFAISQSDLTASLEGETVESALAGLKAQGIEAVRVNTVRELADRHRNQASRTVRFQAHTSDGLTTECFLPTWFCFNDVAAESRQEATRIGSNADEILQKLGYDHDDIVRFKQNGAVLSPEWNREESQNKMPRART